MDQGNWFPNLNAEYGGAFPVIHPPTRVFVPQIWTRLLDFSWAFADPVVVVRGEVRF